MVTAYILIQTEVGKAAKVAKEIVKIEGVQQAEDVTGPYPVMTRTQMRAGLDLLPTWVLEQKAWGRVGYSSLRTS